MPRFIPNHQGDRMAVYRIFPGVGWLYPGAITRIKGYRQMLCLSFDDGPDPDSTPVVSDILGKYNVKAIFFCTGKKASDFPDLVTQLVDNGHVIGNHTWGHTDGFRVSTGKYLDDVSKAAPVTSQKLFRPPFGRMTPRQYKALSGQYKIFLWDILATDFDLSSSGASIKRGLHRKVRDGSVIALHDRIESLKKNFLEEFIESCLNQGYKFTIPDYTN